MIYKPFRNLDLSQLGMGNMRLPTQGEGGPIDKVKARKMIEYAYEKGINYFDTAYRYHNGESEKFVGEVLSQYPRDTWFLASKMPGHAMQPGWTPQGIFEEQLRNCGVEYFDFYLLHNLCETSIDTYMDEALGILDYLLEQKKAGKIRHLGFSTHGRPETIEKFLEWRDCFDFAQIQLNYLDWTLQDGKRKYEILREHDLPIMVMEPCRGGRLAYLSEDLEGMLKKARPNDSIASWAFRFVKSLPGVTVVLSGMNHVEQVDDNVWTFSDFTPLSEAENKLLEKVVEELAEFVPCTSCRYCCEGCPQSLEIPKLISVYNEMAFDPSPGLWFTVQDMKKKEDEYDCISCGKCEEACPQGIQIPRILAELRNKLFSWKPSW